MEGYSDQFQGSVTDDDVDGVQDAKQKQHEFLATVEWGWEGGCGVG